MRTPSAARAALVLAVAACALATAAGRASAQPDGATIAAPVVVPSRYEMRPDEVVDITIAGFASRTVTISVCGNNALRGSTDCNMAASESTRMNADASERVVALPVSAPPMPCPCVIRVASPTNDEVAIADITLVGHPVADPVAGTGARQPLTASVRAERVSGGVAAWLRSSLGGATAYDVTVTVGNTSTVAADNVAARAFVGRRPGHVMKAIDVPVPDRIEPGGTWDYTTRVELSAPVWGSAHWRVDISSNAPTVVASDATSHLPVLLFVVVAVLVLDVLVLGVRFLVRTRRRARRRRRDQPAKPSFDDVIEHAGPERELVDA